MYKGPMAIVLPDAALRSVGKGQRNGRSGAYDSPTQTGSRFPYCVCVCARTAFGINIMEIWRTSCLTIFQTPGRSGATEAMMDGIRDVRVCT